MTNEELEPWTRSQRSLPILVGLVWIAAGLLVVFLAYPEFSQHWEFLVWGIAMALGGLFVLYLRVMVLPSVRKF